MNWKLPNQLTIGRILLSAVFFVLLGVYEPGTTGGRWVLNAALVIYIVAGITDVLDGYLARKWDLTSAFGRIVDPFVDKVLVVGAFIMLTGSNFVMAGSGDSFEAKLPGWLTGHMSSSVQAWMAMLIMAREFIVSAVRGYSESLGVQFPASFAGKVKMFIQSVAICGALYQQANVPHEPWAVVVKVLLVWVAVLITVISSLAYVRRAVRLLRMPE